MTGLDPTTLLRPRRPVTGMSAVLLPYADGAPAWDDFETLLAHTLDAGLVPAVNMDTGYANLIDDSTRTEVLDRTQKAADRREVVAGAFVADEPGAPLDVDAYRRAIEPIAERGATPVVFQSFGLTGLSPAEIGPAYEALTVDVDRFIAFELGTQFAPFGRIYDLDVYRSLLDIDRCVGAKHSSLSRTEEWRRLLLRDEHRPGFMVLTGNDLAIDMIMYGSDYLLGLSAFAPDLFARRDDLWEQGDPAFYELNDKLQYLGAFAFRDPVPAYKHSAAQFLHERRWIATPDTHPRSATRPDSDREVLRTIAASLDLEVR